MSRLCTRRQLASRGFDAITGGGLPRNRTSLIFGGPGSGKTVFALQTMVNGARQFGEPGIFVAFEENSRHILANAASFGWNLPQLEKKQLLFLYPFPEIAPPVFSSPIFEPHALTFPETSDGGDSAEKNCMSNDFASRV